jgi:hypothetical protein
MSCRRTRASTRRLLLLVLFLVLLCPIGLGAEESYLHQRVIASLIVADPDVAADRIEAWTTEKGGYVLFKSGTRVVVRIPPGSLADLRGLLAGVAFQITEFSPEATDLREATLTAESALRSRIDMQEKDFALLDKADVPGTLAVEKEMTSLIVEIETLRATLKRLEVQRLFAVAEISLRFEKTALPREIPSSFRWVNEAGFYKLMEGF